MAKGSKKGMSYAGSGVDVSGEGNAIRSLIDNLTFRRKGLGKPVDIGAHYTGIIDFGDWYLSLCTDGVGSKMMIAEEMGKWDTVGIDCMAMNVNDMICIGAQPLAFVDYIASRHPTAAVLSEIGKGLNEGARLSNLTIIGGETASLPDMVNGLDLAGTCMGAVRKDEAVIGGSIREGDLIFGIPSSGLHSNGFTLVRKVVSARSLRYSQKLVDVLASDAWKDCEDPNDRKKAVEAWARSKIDSTLGEILLEPTRIYVRDVLRTKEKLPKGSIHGLAHITGGGLRNIARLNREVRYSITDPLPVLPVFRLVQVLGGIDEREMYQTFNMGMGFIIIVDGRVGKDAKRLVGRFGGRVVGKVERGNDVHLAPLSMDFDSYI